MEHEIEGLETLIKDIDAFTGKIFDWVSFLGRVDMLHQAYGFRQDAEKKLLELQTRRAASVTKEEVEMLLRGDNA